MGEGGAGEHRVSGYMHELPLSDAPSQILSLQVTEHDYALRPALFLCCVSALIMYPYGSLDA